MSSEFWDNIYKTKVDQELSWFQDGPKKCSGLPITQYSGNDLKLLFEKHFTSIKCFEDIHSTPWNSDQSFTYCVFKNK